MNTEKINYVYVGMLLFLIGCYGSLEWWKLQDYKHFPLMILILLLVCLKLKGVAKFWKYVLCLTFLLLGVWTGSNAPSNPARQLEPYFQQEVLAYGSIAPESVKRYPYGTSFVLRCEQVQIEKPLENLEAVSSSKRLFANSEESFLNGKLFANSEESFQIQNALSNLERDVEFEKRHFNLDYKQNLRVFTKEKDLPLTGQVWCQGELLPLNTLRNPGGFDGERWNYLQGLGGRLRKAKVEVVGTEASLLDRITVINLHLREKILSVAGGEAGALLCGMLLGGSTGLSDEVREAFADNGLAHLLSVSGTHFALLAGFLLLVLHFLPTKARKLCVFLLLCAYAVLCGMKPPIMRALCMSVVLLFSGSGGARGNLLCMVALVLLCFSSAWLLDVGFQLSFGAVAGLIWLYPNLKNYFCNYLPVILGEAMALTLAAQLAIVPLLVHYFHQLPLISLVSNILLVPVLELATLLAMLGVVLDCVLPVLELTNILTMLGINLDFVVSVGEKFIAISAWLVEQVLVQAEFLAHLPFSTVVVGSLPLWCTVFYYFGLCLWADVPCLQFLRNRERRGLLFLSGAMLLGTLFWKQLAPVPFTAYFLDVGQGDCAVVVTPTHKVIVIDTGGLKNFDTGSRVLVPFLHSMGKSKVDALLLSHGDLDHAGGAGALARNMEIERIILPATGDLSESEEALLRNSSESTVERASVGREYVFDDVVLEIVDVPRSGNISRTGGNKGSTVASVKFEQYSLLFTGDINSGRERFLRSVGEYDVLKVAHHGSKHSSSLKFLQEVNPKVAVISVGGGNSYGHPHKETLQRLASVGSKVLRTDELGAIKLVFDDAGIKCYSYVYNSKNF
ncbi:MAG: DNA internalization-related competence protein ComEC/Rec2 [Phascolarctobacterium sp.]|nr:DNA internalization-related competence protein ComEC/Rec2 [Phascolarctobacterium sp.]